jgi:citrate/tricarballylate utilization protein
MLPMTHIPIMDLGRPEAEVQRVMVICNACRYCEGFCAVFPAMERRLDFLHGDIHFLANLCHNCGACFHSCQYAPPHAFAVNVPKALAEVRAVTYETYAWPAALGALYRHQGLWLALALAAGLTFFLLLALQLNGGIFPRPGARGSFYAVIPHAAMAAPFLAASAWILCAFGVGVVRFWRGLPAKPERVSLPAAAADAAQSALTLRNLDGGGAGCNEASDAPSPWRRRFHHATFYGFMLCFASTCVATWYHYVLKLQAPYPWTSVPVLLGGVGGVGLLAGTAGLLWLHAQRHPDLGDRTQRAMDVGFMVLLFATSLTGLLLLIFRDGAAMPLLLAVHLGVVAAFFITLPYGKFAHAVYRVAALVKDAIEKRRPDTIVLKLD